MKKFLLAASLSVAAHLAFAAELKILPQRHSLHVGESISCPVYFTREYRKSLRHKDWSLWRDSNGRLFNIPFRPKRTGWQTVGPISLTIGEERLTAEAVSIYVLPDPGTNSMFEIRIYQDRIRENEALEVVVQWREQVRIPNPYAKADHLEWEAFYLQKEKETEDWKLRTKQRNRLGGRSGHDAFGDYIIRGRLEVYDFVPRRTGRLVIDESLFRNLPPDYIFKPRTITVTKVRGGGRRHVSKQKPPPDPFQ